MAERQQFATVASPDPILIRLLEDSRDQEVSEAELREQRISFAFGNALNLEGITKDSVRVAAENLRVRR